MSEATTATFTHEDMIRKVAGLLKTAESFSEQGNDEAAAVYIQKAHALQQKYSIDAALLAEATGQKVQKIVSRVIKMQGRHGRRKVNLAHAIANATGCTGYYSMGKHNIDGLYSYTVFGFEQDVDHVETLIQSLNAQVDASLSYASKHIKSSYEHGKSFSASFIAGFTGVISSRLQAAKREATAQAKAEQTDGGTSMALVLVNKTQQVKDEMRARVGRLGKGTVTATTSSNGYYAGRDAGTRASLARGSVGSNARGSLNS
jgi:hypothetical protein